MDITQGTPTKDIDPNGNVGLAGGIVRPSLAQLARLQRERNGGPFGLSQGQQGGRSLGASKVEAAYVSYSTTFNGRLKTATKIGRSLATVIEDDAIVHTELWTTAAPLLREWIGPKVLHKLRAESHQITTSPKEASVEIPKNDILYDKYGLWQPKISGLADAFEFGINDLVFGMLVAGIQGTALGATYDGQNLIDTDHTALSIGGGAQSNHVAGALTATTFNTGMTRFLTMVNENGLPINDPGRRVRLVVGPANRLVARDIIDAQTLANGASNQDRGVADLIVTPYLTAGRQIRIKDTTITVSGTEWFLIPENSSAVVVQIKRMPELLAVDDPNSAYAFLNSKFLYGVETEFGAGYGMWQEIVGGPGA